MKNYQNSAFYITRMFELYSQEYLIVIDYLIDKFYVFVYISM